MFLVLDCWSDKTDNLKMRFSPFSDVVLYELNHRNSNLSKISFLFFVLKYQRPSLQDCCIICMRILSKIS